MRNSKVWSLCHKSGLSARPWGCLPLTHILLLSFLLYQKRVHVDEDRFAKIPLPPGVAYAPPLSKTQRPIFRTLSDKHDLLIVLSLLRRRPTGRWIFALLRLQHNCRCRRIKEASDHATLVQQEADRTHQNNQKRKCSQLKECQSWITM